MDNKEIYDFIYTQNENYNPPALDKFQFIDDFLRGATSIIEVGCGAGNYLKRYHDQLYNIIGLEISEVCCNTYLQDYPYINSDLITYSKQTHNRYSHLYCFDVLEHIQETQINEFVESCLKLSNTCLFGIANHSDIQYNIELHPIQQNSAWWVNLLNKYFKYVTIIHDTNRFFVIECLN